MPTFVPSIFSSTINDGSAMNASDAFRSKCLSSSVPLEPNRCGVRGYLTKLSREAPIIGNWHEQTGSHKNKRIALNRRCLVGMILSRIGRLVTLAENEQS